MYFLIEYPGVYSRISSQYEWIKDTVCNNSTRRPDWCGAPEQQKTCVDSSLKFKVVVNMKWRYKDCAWVGRNPEKRCRKFKLFVSCPSTCGKCDEQEQQCVDFPHRFKVVLKNGMELSKSCTWANTWRCNNFSGLPETCRATCGRCKNRSSSSQPIIIL